MTRPPRRYGSNVFTPRTHPYYQRRTPTSNEPSTEIEGSLDEGGLDTLLNGYEEEDTLIAEAETL